MSSGSRQPASLRQLKEFDNLTESISDLVHQLQDIDPTRLSFSPFLDLDTQISLAPVSDSPESSVSELNSVSVSAPGSRTSIEILSVEEQCEPATREDGRIKDGQNLESSSSEVSLKVEREAEEEEEEEEEQEELELVTLGMISETSFLDVNKDIDGSVPQNINTRVELHEELASDGAEEEQPFLGNNSWPSSPSPEDTDRGCKKCCLGVRLRLIMSSFAALLLTPCILYGTYMYLPFDPPVCRDLSERIVYAIQCCVVLTLPVILGLLSSAAATLCSATTQDSPAQGATLQQVFVSSSSEHLSLYALNLVALATFLEQGQLRAIPILAGLFGISRLLYWVSLHVCSSLRGFASGLSFCPLLAMSVFNTSCICGLNFLHLLLNHFGSNSSETTATPGTG
ncbi:uncharacterized protein LOC120537593 [Polypterus senegalus]|nr:uncharacterized protein LOC120537593 [Polypterus senegalus]XP_039622580.1 uncharacterized protein LOC120537593 [Polypterus senegalus]XP_039622581.1 uncharacterized protein LOC120537593 [Polypterus senegalus]